MRTMPLPTPAQRRCRHTWRVTSTVSLRGRLIKRRYYKCLKCDLHTRTIEQPDVSWMEGS